MFKVSQDPNDIYCGLVGGRHFRDWPENAQYVVFKMQSSYDPPYDKGDTGSWSSVPGIERIFTSTEQLKAWAERQIKELDQYLIFEVKRQIHFKTTLSI